MERLLDVPTFRWLLCEKVISHHLDSWIDISDTRSDKIEVLQYQLASPGILVMEGKQIVALASTNIHDESRLGGRPVQELAWHRKPINPVFSRTHGVAHEEIEVFE